MQCGFGDTDSVDEHEVIFGGGIGCDDAQVVVVDDAHAAAFHLLEEVAAPDHTHKHDAFDWFDVSACRDHVYGDRDTGVVTSAERLEQLVWFVTGVGGLVGENGLSIPSFNVPGTIINCYSAGGVDGGIFAGGLFGTNSSGEITASFWDIETSGQQTSGGGMGKTTAEMQMANTFLDAGWDFAAERVNGIEEIWSICEGQDYPKLALQFLKGDFDGDRRVLFADFAVFFGLAANPNSRSVSPRSASKS